MFSVFEYFSRIQRCPNKNKTVKTMKYFSHLRSWFADLLPSYMYNY